LVSSLLSSATAFTIFKVEEYCYGLLDFSRVIDREVEAFAVALDFLTISLSSISNDDVICVLNWGETF
jgi:hypothetical protein